MQNFSANKQPQAIFSFASQHVKGPSPSHSIDVKIDEPNYPGDGWRMDCKIVWVREQEVLVILVSRFRWIMPPINCTSQLTSPWCNECENCSGEAGALATHTGENKTNSVPTTIVSVSPWPATLIWNWAAENTNIGQICHQATNLTIAPTPNDYIF